MDPIDAVYTWVDGRRPLHMLSRMWQGWKQNMACCDSRCRHRFIDHDELRYSLRSVELYAPWIRNVYIVTNGTYPKWLRNNHPRIRLVHHKDIFRLSQDLPTFNSRAIELQLGTIPGISEQFLYFNDDVFLGKRVHPEDFFDAQGRRMILFSGNAIEKSPRHKNDASFICGLKNSDQVLDARFGISQRYHIEHHPQPMLRNIFHEIAADFPAEVRKTSGNKFRSRCDISANSCLCGYYAWHTKRAFKGSLPFFAAIILNNESDNIAALKHIEEKKPTLFCINDSTTKPCTATWRALEATLKRLYPDPSTFERSSA